MFFTDPHRRRPLRKRLIDLPHLPFPIHREDHELLPLHLKQQSIIEAIDANDSVMLKLSRELMGLEHHFASFIHYLSTLLLDKIK